jgi:hypothetical protein
VLLRLFTAVHAACVQFLCSVCSTWKAARYKHGSKCSDCHNQQHRHPPAASAAAPAPAAPSPPPPQTAHAAHLQLLAHAAAASSPGEALQPAVPPNRKRKYASHNDDLRACVVRLHECGLSWSQVEETSGVPRSTAQDVARLQRTEGRTCKRRKGGNRNPVISNAVRQLIAALQNADASLRLQDTRCLLDLVCIGSPPCLNTIWRIEQAAGFSTKQMSAHAAPRNTLATKEKRAEWCRNVGAKLVADEDIFIDESPFSYTIIRRRGRSRKGQPAIAVTPQIRGRNHSVIAALSPTRGLLYYQIKVTEPDEEFLSKRKGSKKKKTRPKGVTRDVFRSFLINLFATPAFQSASKPFTLLFDNVRMHLGDIEETIFQAGHTRQLLAAWSPALNPIEYAFSKWKLAYRALRADSEAAVDECIKQSATCIKPADCQHWFEHTQRLYAKCLAMEDL